MSEAVCFRCDWQGRVRGRTCPVCGAPLHRPSPAGPPSASRETVDAVTAREEQPTAAVGHDPRRASAPRGLAIALVAALALGTVASIQLLAKDGSPPRSDATGGHPSPVSGTLVYLARPDHGPAALWMVDPATGRAHRGPQVPATTVELVDASGAFPGWIGFETLAPDHRFGASVLEGLTSSARVVSLGRGHLVAWGPGGDSVVLAKNGRVGASERCSKVRVALVTVLTQKIEWALNDPGFCGPLLSISRSAAATYFTAASGDRMSVFLTGSVGLPHLMFENVAMLSASPPSAFLLAREGGAGTSPVSSNDGEALLGWKGIGGPVTVASGDDPLVIDHVLAWAPDGSRVALVGTVGTTRGVFVVDAGSGSGPREPHFVMPAAAGLDATFDRTGRLYVAVNGRLVESLGRATKPITLPEDAPPPAGPIVWIR